MALQVLTSEQKEALKTNVNFQREVKWAILDKSSYWSGHDGTTPPGGIERWRKSKTLGNEIVDSPSRAEAEDNVSRFLVYLKNTQCADDQVAFDADAVVTFLKSNNHFDTMADVWFDNEIEFKP